MKTVVLPVVVVATAALLPSVDDSRCDVAVLEIDGGGDDGRSRCKRAALRRLSPWTPARAAGPESLAFDGAGGGGPYGGVSDRRILTPPKNIIKDRFG
ncbi:hypothetical protein BDA96_05G031000 [Sorghum bicolor]|uniref:Secreted protein n=1 Tax=Sorghum bicolor TaxID=4558 RepID=A0A921QVA8_SORBI|nr:hypothetical protein BDA96_05G031000 [Sorghum bicolor]